MLLSQERDSGSAKVQIRHSAVEEVFLAMAENEVTFADPASPFDLTTPRAKREGDINTFNGR
jgi:hypothetical protein